MASSKVIGIDLGTTMSVAAFTDPAGTTTAIADGEGHRIIPSAVYFPQGEPMVVGEKAKRHAVIEPARVAMLFKRGMGTPFFLPDKKSFVVDEKIWVPEELSSLVLKRLKEMAEDYFHEPVTDAVVTVPAYFGDQARSATKSAGEIAGLNVLQIQNEPTAAAIAHGLDSGAEPGRFLVFDLGGGTFDVTVMEVESSGQLNVIATGGARTLGGADFDDLILNRLRAEVRAQAGGSLDDDVYALSEARDKAETMKKDLSSAQSASCTLIVDGKRLQVTVTRREFEGMLADSYLTDVSDTIENTIDDARLAPSDLSKVLMVGGSSRIPAFQRLLEDLLGQKPVFTRNLDEDVARGAALVAAKLANTVDPRTKIALMPTPRDVTSQGLGITVYESDLVTKYNDVVIKPNTPVPAEGSSMYRTLEEGQTEILVELNEGNDRELRYVERLGDSPALFGRQVRKGYPLRIEMKYTSEQIIVVDGYDGESNKLICHMEVPRKGLMSRAGKEAAIARLAGIRVQG